MSLEGQNPNPLSWGAYVSFRQLRTYAELALGSFVPILLQKSFSTADQNFSSPLMRFADKYVRDLISS
jgi:hypothetical protein